MNVMRRTLMIFSMVMVGAWTLSAARAQSGYLGFSPDPVPSSIAPGSTLDYTATLSNLDMAYSLSLDAGTPGFTVRDASGNERSSDYVLSFYTLTNNFDSTPAQLAPQGQSGDMYSGSLFTLQIGAGAQTGDRVVGSYTLDYTRNDGTTDSNGVIVGTPGSVTQQFAFTVEPTPAPCGLLSLGIGLCCQSVQRARKRKRRDST